METKENSSSDDDASNLELTSTAPLLTNGTTVISPPPRLQFDEGTRIMEEGSVGLGTTSNRSGTQENDESTKVFEERRCTIRPESIDIDTYYEIERSCHEIVEGLNLHDTCSTNNSHDHTSFLCRVALQFPDELLGDATEVCWKMEQGLMNQVMANTDRRRRRKLSNDASSGAGGLDLGASLETANDTIPDVAPTPPPLVFILGDTTHGACCVDVVAAQHLQADWIVHYGRACLTPISVPPGTKKIPVTYVFGRGNSPLDVSDCATQLRDYFASNKIQSDEDLQKTDKKRHLVVLYDVLYSYAMNDLYSTLSCAMGDPALLKDNDNNEGTKLRGSGWNVLMSHLPSEDESTSHCPSSQMSNIKTSDTSADRSKDERMQKGIKEEGHTINIGGLEIDLPNGIALSDCDLVYVGNQCTSAEERHLMNVLLRCTSTGENSPKSCCVYEPSTCTLTTDVNALCRRTIQRRFYCVQKARTVSVFGIVVGTLALDGFQEVVGKLQHLIEEEACRTCYTFSVGKLNPAKLGNFGDIVECFVLVNCPEHSLLDNELSKDYPIPIITPLECAMALGSREWDGFYSLDCIRDYLLPELKQEEHSEENKQNDSERKFDNNDEYDQDEDQPFFDITTGKYVSVVGHKGRRNNSEYVEHQNLKRSDEGYDKKTISNSPEGTVVVAKTEKDQQLMVFPTSAAVEVFKKREYQGLRANIGQTPVLQALPGQRGIASMYSDMPNQSESEER